MLGHDEEAAIHADTYIDSLLERPVGPAIVGEVEPPADDAVGRAIRALAGLPRFHPSFAFEEALAARLRHVAEAPSGRLADIISLPVATLPAAQLGAVDRRVLLGGAIVGGAAIASGVSFAAMLAWRQAGRRDRRSGRGLA